MKQFIKNNFNRKMLMLSLLAFCFFQSQTTNAQDKKKVFKYSYDAAGNRTKREYILATPCPGNPNCRTKPNDTLFQRVFDSLAIVAQGIEIKEPDVLVGKESYSYSVAELKNIYPNPTKGLFVLEFTNFISNATLFITDLNGGILDEILLNGRQWEIDLTLFPANQYILNIKTLEGNAYSRKIIKL